MSDQKDTQFSVMRLSDLKDTGPQRDHGDLTGLKESICKWGLLEPLVVTPEGGIIAGRRRFQALTEVGLDIVPVRIRNPKNAYERFLMSWDENRHRKAETWQEEGKNALLEQRLYEEQFPETKHGASAAKNFPNLEVAKLTTSEEDAPPRYTETRAAVSGTSERTAQRQVEMGLALEEHPELAECKTESQARRKLHHAAILAKPVKFPTGKYAVILADPPWRYDNSGFSNAAESQYPTLDLEAICDHAKHIEGWATSSTVLFLWATNPLLPEALQVMAAWGFTYKTNLAWIKDKARGFAWFAKSKHELLLIGVRPDTLHPMTQPDSCFEAPRGAVHSKKPEDAYAIIESMYVGPKLEMFTRSQREGWDSHGNEC